MDKKLAEEKVREMLASLTPEQLAELQNSFAETMDTIKNESVEKLETLKVELERLQTEKKSLGAEYSNWDKKQELNQAIEIVSGSILNQENVIKVLENNGLISNVTDEHGYEYKDVPDFRKVDTSEFTFDEKTVLISPIPKYVPLINEEKFKGHGYVFDAIRITEDSYMVSLGSYSRKEKGKNNFFIATLDQLVLIIDYYYTKAKAKNIEDARRSNERSKEHYFSLSEEKRRYYMFYRNVYESLSVANKKKISKEDFEALDLEGREKYYLPIKTYGVKRIISKLGEGEMWVSFHNMYEDLIDKTKTIINQKGKLYADPTVIKYWRDFVEMINYKLKDIKIQREDYSDTYKQAIETSFGESNVDTVLKEKYGILVKRQNGDKIKPVEIDLIEKSWIKIQSVYGNLKAEAVKNNLKISHSGERLMFAMKALGVFIPQMGTIGVSNKLGEIDFRSTFSHETAHFIDNFIGKLNGKRWATDDYESLAGKIAFTFRNSMNKSKSDQTDYINATKECFARAMQQYFGMKTEGEDAITKNVDNKIAPEGIEISKHPNFVNKFTFKDEVEPLIEQFLKENLDVFETTVDIDGTNDLAPITEEEVENVEEESIQTLKLKVMKLWTKAFKMMPQSIGQKKVIKEIDEINDKIEKLGGDKVIEKQEPEATVEDILKPFKDIVLESKSFDEAFDKVSDVQGVPREVSAFFFEKYNPNNRLDKHDTFLKFYTEVKGEQPAEEPEESIQDLIDGLEILVDISEGEEKKELEDTIEGLKLLLDSDKFALGGLIEYGKSFGKIIKEDDGVYTIETEDGEIKQVLAKFTKPYIKKENISLTIKDDNNYENNLGKLSVEQKESIIKKIGGFNINEFYKNHKSIKERRKIFDLFNINEENISDIQSKRHILHSTNEIDLFNSSSSYSTDFNNNVSIVADTISEINIVGLESNFSSFISGFDDSERGSRYSDLDLDYLDEDIDTEDEKYRLLNLIKIEKEELNFAIELYLSYLDEVWDKLNLDEFKDNYHWKKKDFKPSGFLRNRLL